MNVLASPGGQVIRRPGRKKSKIPSGATAAAMFDARWLNCLPIEAIGTIFSTSLLLTRSAFPAWTRREQPEVNFF